MANGELMMKEVRLSFPTLAKPENNFDPSKPRYGVTAVFVKDGATYKALLEEMKAVATAKWGEQGLETLKQCLANSQRSCLRKNKNDPNLCEVNAYNDLKHPPLLLRADKTILRDEADIERELYAGCYANVKIGLWCQDNKNGKAIRAALLGVQFAKDGDRFQSAGSTASLDDFEIVESAQQTTSTPEASTTSQSENEFF